jgi:hypothetical protein
MSELGDDSPNEGRMILKESVMRITLALSCGKLADVGKYIAGA